MNTATATPADVPQHPHGDQEKDHEMDRAAAAKLKMGLGQRTVVAILLTVVLVPPLAGFYSYFSGVPLHLLASTAKTGTEEEEAEANASISLVQGKPHTVEVTDEVAAALGIRKKDGKESVATAQVPTAMRPLELPGSTDFDPSRLARIRARFAPARVVKIPEVHDLSSETGRTEFRELRQGDTVAKGDLLGVFYSVDVGSKKNDLLQALVQLELDQTILDRFQRHVEAIPPALRLTQERAVQGDRTEIHRALNNLILWDIPQDEIDALHAEARKICADKDAWSQTPEGQWVKRCIEKEDAAAKEAAPKGAAAGVQKAAAKETAISIKDAVHAAGRSAPGAQHLDAGKEQLNPWGTVTLRAPFGGVIVERNLHKDELVVDNTVNLYQIADVSRLLVKANCPEDHLPALEALQGVDRRWTVRTVGASSADGLAGPIAEIGYIIDPNQHTAVIKGYVNNPGKQIRAGQYVTATINVPPPRDVVEIPVDALVDDGKQSLVFVQPDPAKRQYTMRRVHVTNRFDKTVLVRNTPLPKADQLTAAEAEEGLLPKEPLRPGDRVLLAGSVELKRVTIDLESRRKEQPNEELAKARMRSALEIESRVMRKPKSGKG
jgi:cobalt-zinc-cadmium efflux system membrane fusion protein